MKKSCTLLKKTLLIVSIALSFKINSQVLTPHINPQVERCASDQIHRQQLNDPAYVLKMQQYENYVQSIQNSTNKVQNIIYKVPVVVNVMYKGEAIGIGSNVSDDAIQNAIKLMNQMYRKEAGTAYNATGVDVEIEYVLAVRDPNGNCTNGINRISMTGNSAYMSNGVDRNSTGGISDAALKATYSWDQTKYYNIWLVYEIDNNEGGSGIQGYAYFASSHGTAQDGALILASNFTSGTSTTAAHEIGHSLNLYHTFEGDGTGTSCPSTSNGCGSGLGDCCVDIPSHKRSSSDCVTGTNSCDGTTARDLFIHNYMDYSSDVCQNMLTANQKTRMVASVSTTRASFLGSDNGGTNMGLVPVSTAGVDFESSASILCGTGQSVTFVDKSSCIPNSYLSTSSTTGVSHLWTITNGTNTYTSTAQNPTIAFNNTGTFNVTLQVTNALGTTSATKTGMVVVSSAPTNPCSPTTSNAGNFGQTVNNITFNTINSASSANINTAFTNNVCNYNTIVTAGNTYQLSITANSGPTAAEVFEVYINYNNDNDFADAGELVFSGTTGAINSSGTYTTNVIIPGTAIQNNLLRMRVIGNASSISSSDRTCGAPLFVGDVEDLGLYILPAGCSAPTITGTTPASRCGNGTVVLGAAASAGTVNWYAAATGGTAIATGTSYTTTSLSATTTYYVDATNVGCTTASRTSVIASVNANPTVAAVANPTVICAGSTSTLTGSGASTYTWNPGALTGATVAVTPTATTIYTITGTSTLGCTATKTLNLTVSPNPTVTAVSSPTAICAGSPATLTGSGATTYTWNPGALTGTSVVFTPTATTIYTVIGTTGSCSNTKTVSLTVNALPILAATSNPTVLCIGNTSTLTGSGASSYTWNPGALAGSTIAVTPTATTIYTVAGTNTLGCTGTKTLNLTVTPIPTVTAVSSSTTICAGSSATLTGSGASTYTWNPGALTGSTISVSPTVTTTYTLVGKSAAGCAGTKTLNLTVNLTVVPSIVIAQTVGTNPMCSGTSTTFTATPTNGGSTPSYQWKVNGGNIGTNSPTYTTTGLTTGQNVTCILTSNASCAAPTTATSSAVTMTVNSSVTPNIVIAQTSGSNPSCTGSPVTFTATPTNGGSTPAYQWQVDGVNTGTSSSFTSSSLNNGEAVTCILTSNAACAATTTAISSAVTMTISGSVTPGISIAMSSGSNPMCIGTSATFSASPVNGGLTPDYQWLVDGVNAGTNSSTFTSTLNNGEAVTCILTSNSSCASTPTAISSAITATTSTPPAVSASAGSTIICNGSGTTLTGIGATTYSWNTGASTATISVSPTLNTTYTVTGTTSGCSNTDVITITVNALPNVNIAGTSTLCTGTSSVLTASGALSYIWNTAETTSTINAAPVSSTIYSVTGTDANGCDNIATHTVNAVTCSSETAMTSLYMCNLKISSTNYPVWANPVTGATAYNFKFYNPSTNALIASLASPTRSINIGSVSGLYYGNVYRWTVAVDKGIGFGPESVGTCTLSIEEPKPTVPCGKVISNLATPILASVAGGVSSFKFTLYNDVTNALIAVKTQTSNYLYLNQVPGIAYGNTYKITVQAQYNNGTGLVYGTPSSSLCTVTIAAPIANLPCGNTYTNTTNPYTGITAVSGVTGYKVNCYDISANALVGAKTFTSNYIYIKQIPGMVYNTSYYWTVECQYNNGTGLVFGPASTNTCIMTWGTAPAVIMDGGNNATVRLNEDTSEDEVEQSTINLYPNPNNGLFNIELNKSAQISVTNVLGQEILNETMEAGQHNLDIQNQSTGIYFVKVIQKGKQHVIKLIKE